MALRKRFRQRVKKRSLSEQGQCLTPKKGRRNPTPSPQVKKSRQTCEFGRFSDGGAFFSHFVSGITSTNQALSLRAFLCALAKKCEKNLSLRASLSSSEKWGTFRASAHGSTGAIHVCFGKEMRKNSLCKIVVIISNNKSWKDLIPITPYKRSVLRGPVRPL